jgi:chromosome partitioning protein
VTAAYRGLVVDGLPVETQIPGVSLVPGSVTAREANVPPESGWDERQWALQGLVQAVQDRYDICLIDCPPMIYQCSWSALLAADSLVVPLQPEDYGSQGLGPVQDAYELARPLNPGLALSGFLLMMVDARLTVHQTYEAMLREAYGDLLFNARIPRAKDFVEAVASRQTVNQFKPRSQAAKAVRAVAEELLQRIQIARAGQGVAA